LAASITQAHPEASVELIPGKGGVFTVRREGLELWNKKEQGRFPEHAEILSAL